MVKKGGQATTHTKCISGSINYWSMHLKWHRFAHIVHDAASNQHVNGLHRQQRSQRSGFIRLATSPCSSFLAHGVEKYSQINKQVITKPPKWLLIPVNLMTTWATRAQTQRGLNQLSATWQRLHVRVTFRMCKRLKSIRHGSAPSASNQAPIRHFPIWRDRDHARKSTRTTGGRVFPPARRATSGVRACWPDDKGWR